MPDFSDLFGDRFAGRDRRVRRVKKSARAPATRPPREAIAAEGLLILVEDDSLVFRCQTKTADVSSIFRQAFREVWERIPPADRQRLLGYWRSDPEVESLFYDYLAPNASHPKPLIQVLDGEPSLPVSKRLGHELSFSIGLVLGDPGCLTLEIARTLVHVYRYATRDFWRLVIEQIEDPISRWERTRKTEPKWETRERKLDALEAAYLPKHEAAVSGVIRKWGFE